MWSGVWTWIGRIQQSMGASWLRMRQNTGPADVFPVRFGSSPLPFFSPGRRASIINELAPSLHCQLSVFLNKNSPRIVWRVERRFCIEDVFDIQTCHLLLWIFPKVRSSGGDGFPVFVLFLPGHSFFRKLGCQVSIRFTFLDFRLKNAGGATEKLLRSQSEGSCLVVFWTSGIAGLWDPSHLFFGESNTCKLIVNGHFWDLPLKMHCLKLGKCNGASVFQVFQVPI